MKILNIIQRYPPGISGSEIWCRNLCRFLSKKGIFTNVITINVYNIADSFNDPLCIKLGRYDSDGNIFIKRYGLWNPWSCKIIRFLFRILHLDKTTLGESFKISVHSIEMYKNMLKDIKDSDIVILHTLPYFHNIIGYIIARFYRKPILIVPHFHPGHQHYEKRLFYRLINGCDAVIAITQYDRNYLVSKGVREDRIYITGNAVQKIDIDESSSCIKKLKRILEDEYRIKESDKKVIFLGRKDVYKGVFDLIDAMEQLAAEVDDKLVLFLVGPRTPYFNNRYSKYSLESNRLKILELDVVSEDEKNYIIKISDLLVLPSKFEAFGIVFLEAWYYEKPVIGTTKGAMPEIIGEAGLCAEYENIDDLKNKIKKILFNKKLAEKMGKIGREKVEKIYTIERVYGRMFTILNRLSLKKKILIVSHLFPTHSFCGGSEIIAYQHANMLKKMDFDVHIFAGRFNNKLYRPQKDEFDIKWVDLSIYDSDFKFARIYRADIEEKFEEYLYDIGPDIVHFHNIYLFPINIIGICQKWHIPMVMTLHDYYGVCFKNTFLNDNGIVCNWKNKECLECDRKFLFKDNIFITINQRNRLFRDYFNKIDLLISPSKYLADIFEEKGIGNGRIKTIYNSIDISRFSPLKKIKSKIIRFGYIGQIREHKGLTNLFRAISLLTDIEKAGISLSVIGSGEDRYINYYQRMIKTLRLRGIVHFLGEVDNKEINKIYRKIDILIVPSIWPENSPITIIEAMAAGTPVLASNIGGIPEMIEDGVNGYLHIYDSPQSLAENIRKVLRCPDIIKNMSQECLKKAERYNVEKQIKTIIRCYDNILLGRRFNQGDNDIAV